MSALGIEREVSDHLIGDPDDHRFKVGAAGARSRAAQKRKVKDRVDVMHCAKCGKYRLRHVMCKRVNICALTMEQYAEYLAQQETEGQQALTSGTAADDGEGVAAQQ